MYNLYDRDLLYMYQNSYTCPTTTNILRHKQCLIIIAKQINNLKLLQRAVVKDSKFNFYSPNVGSGNKTEFVVKGRK